MVNLDCARPGERAEFVVLEDREDDAGKSGDSIEWRRIGAQVVSGRTSPT